MTKPDEKSYRRISCATERLAEKWLLALLKGWPVSLPMQGEEISTVRRLIQDAFHMRERTWRGCAMSQWTYPFKEMIPRLLKLGAAEDFESFDSWEILLRAAYQRVLHLHVLQMQAACTAYNPNPRAIRKESYDSHTLTEAEALRLHEIRDRLKVLTGKLRLDPIHEYRIAVQGRAVSYLMGLPYLWTLRQEQAFEFGNASDAEAVLQEFLEVFGPAARVLVTLRVPTRSHPQAEDHEVQGKAVDPRPRKRGHHVQ